MKAFEFDSEIVETYSRFSRSFSTIRADDLREQVEAEYSAGRFWPESLLSLNPRYLKGPTVDELVSSSDLDEATGQIFRFDGDPIRFHRHQAQAISKARMGQSLALLQNSG